MSFESESKPTERTLKKGAISSAIATLPDVGARPVKNAATKPHTPAIRGMTNSLAISVMDGSPLADSASTSWLLIRQEAVAASSFLSRFLQHLLQLRIAPHDKANHLNTLRRGHCASRCRLLIYDLPITNEHQEIVGAVVVSVQELVVGTVLRDRFGNLGRQRADIALDAALGRVFQLVVGGCHHFGRGGWNQSLGLAR